MVKEKPKAKERKIRAQKPMYFAKDVLEHVDEVLNEHTLKFQTTFKSLATQFLSLSEQQQETILKKFYIKPNYQSGKIQKMLELDPAMLNELNERVEHFKNKLAKDISFTGFASSLLVNFANMDKTTRINFIKKFYLGKQE